MLTLLTGSLINLLVLLGHCDPSDMLELKRDLAHLTDRIELETRRRNFDDVVELRHERREKADELQEWQRVCGPRLAAPLDTTRPLK